MTARAIVLLTALAVATPARAANVVPDRFLRRWDPVTIFFPRDVGPKTPGPEDHPERFVTLAPAHPGAFAWLDARTLQFRPAEPWPPLARFAWTVERKTVRLTTLMAAPLRTLPADDAVGLGVVDAITLTFAEPIDPDALAQMITLELRPLPGVGGEQARWMTRPDFTVKTLERRARSDPATYVLELKTPVPLGTRAVVHFRLSLDDDAAESFAEVAFATAEPFRVLEVGCRSEIASGGARRAYPVTPDGLRYTRGQALDCGAGGRTLLVEFSGAPRDVGPVDGRNLVRFTPPVADVAFAVEGKTLVVSGDFASETLYRVTLAPTALADRDGRPLEMTGESELFVYFPRQPSYLRWGAARGIVERFGPQMVPLAGRGTERLDLRVHGVDPLDRSLWPFPDRPLTVDESKRPPGPGEEPAAHASVYPVAANELQQYVAALGSPSVSTLVSLPLRRDGKSATFGLDLAPHLAAVGGKAAPGTYLVGLRRLDTSHDRDWMRVQVTDLALTTLEEPDAVRFVVTSLAKGTPVAGASVTLEGSESDRWTTLGTGTTAADGGFRWAAPGWESGRPYREVRRIVVRSADDVLVLDPAHAPDGYADNVWSPTHETWLGWAFQQLAARRPAPEDVCHIFTERPVYRPEDVVHVKGWLRRRAQGRLVPRDFAGLVVIDGPGNQTWTRPVTLGPQGGFYTAFKEQNLPTGDYGAHLEDKEGRHYGHVAFRVDAYRIPTFEVELHAPDKAPLDREFEVGLTSTYYAGGKVSGRPVQWRVTQFPYTWSPKKREGFQYSSDGRFSGTQRFESSPKLEKADTTDESGAARLMINPAAEPTAQPRTYVVEATVTGPDDQTVTNTRHVTALPPFVLGLKVPRYLEHATEIAPELIVVGPDGELLPGTEVKVRLLSRQWHSHLRASDFSDGVARYVTDVVDERVQETTVTSAATPTTVRFALPAAGVYVVELEAHDRLGRAQVVAIDLYAGGGEPVSWAKPATRVFEVATDKDAYDPGETAVIVLKSPYQEGRALAVTEAPDGNRYEWLDVKGGSATFKVVTQGTWTPRLPVHFVLMRGRVAAAGPTPTGLVDLGKPSTVAATAWVKVNPRDNRVDVTLENPAKARPGDTVPITVRLKDPDGKPVPGEVALWLVDQAVLALGKEQRLDPLPDFITDPASRLVVRDTRNLIFGRLAFAEAVGGAGGEGEKGGLFERFTVRRSFKPVPYYEPALVVGADGVATVQVKLPDDLTTFKLRAKAASGPDRFGWATGEIAVRQPVIVQPALPRFVRPGDRFTAAGIGRIVEGEGGPGSAEVRVAGATLGGEARREIAWAPERPERIEFPVEVTTPPYDADGRLARTEVAFGVAVARASDGAGDAFEVKLPIRDDRERTTMRLLADLRAGAPVAVPAIPEPARPGTVRRTLVVSDQPAILRMAAGLDYLAEYPYGCTEQRISRAHAFVALRGFRALLAEEGGDERVARPVREALEWLPLVVDEHGLCAYWPGARGSVSLTAWTVQFLVDARDAGFAVDAKLLDTLTGALEHALRSDYAYFIDGEAFVERAFALGALARAGKFNPGYAAELARRAQYLDAEGVAEVVLAFARQGDTASSTVEALVQRLWDAVVVRLHEGKERYGGLQRSPAGRNGLIVPSETRTLAEITQAVARVGPDAPRLPLLVDALVTLGRGDGWGSTNANAAALRALAERVRTGAPGAAHAVDVRLGADVRTVALGPDAPIARVTSIAPDAGVLGVRLETTWIPAADGSQVAAQASGFVVAREWLRVAKGSDAPPERFALAAPGTVLAATVGDVVEDHVQIVSPDDRHYVAIVVPLAAGMEPMNPKLATASADAAPAGKATVEPTYAAYLDDRVAFYYDTLPKGTLDLYFRTRATTAGRFIQPAAVAEMMYDGSVRGTSAGGVVTIAASPDRR